jgi:NAD+ diphosphatase
VSQTHVFAANPLDRVSALRQDPAWLEIQLTHSNSRFLALWRLEILTKKEPRALAWGRGGLCASMDRGVGAVMLGLRDGAAHFAIDLSALDDPITELGLDGVAEFVDARALATQLPAEDAGIVAQARALVDWHDSHRFCARCGKNTASSFGGGMRVCDACKAEHFPRVNPVAIMLVTDGDRCLLGRQRGWPGAMFSALAGFIEPGETIEEAVRREVGEEAGVRVGAVYYDSSQPWPFPSSLMIGCHAEALSQEIEVDYAELEEVRWFTRAEVIEAANHDVLNPPSNAALLLPPKLAIARHLLDVWIANV